MIELNRDEVTFLLQLFYWCPIDKYRDRQKGQDSIMTMILDQKATTRQVVDFLPWIWGWALHFKRDLIPIPPRFATLADWPTREEISYEEN